MKLCPTNLHFKFLYCNCVELGFPTKLSSLSPNSFMASKLLRNRTMPKDHQKRSDDDVLAIEKAAAWAWYQQGSSGSEGKTMREFHITRTQRDHRPSRYKLEAMRMASSSSSQETKEEELSCPVQHTNKLVPLFDAYEVCSILRRLDSLVAESSDGKLDDYGGQRMIKKKKKKVGKGIWERRRVRVMCSARKEDVVDGIRTRASKENHKCSILPRANNGGRSVM